MFLTWVTFFLVDSPAIARATGEINYFANQFTRVLSLEEAHPLQTWTWTTLFRSIFCLPTQLVPESVSERYELGVTTTPLDRFGGCWAWVVPTFAWQDTMTNSFFCFRRALSFLLGKHVQRMTNNDIVR